MRKTPLLLVIIRTEIGIIVTWHNVSLDSNVEDSDGENSDHGDGGYGDFAG